MILFIGAPFESIGIEHNAHKIAASVKIMRIILNHLRFLSFSNLYPKSGVFAMVLVFNHHYFR